MWETAGPSLGISALLNMLLTVVLIVVSWWAIQAFKFDLFIRSVNSPQAKVLQLLLAVLIGHGVASFFIQYMNWTAMLRYIMPM